MTAASGFGLLLVALVATAVVRPTPAAAAPHRSGMHNVAADPYFLQACDLQGALSHRCISQTVAAINHARARESMRKTKMVLPRNYANLTRAEQAFVVINLERVNRGLRPIAGMLSRLNHVAKVSAVAELDPAPAMALLRRLGVHRYQVVWAHDYGVLAADYEWMYDDGFDGTLTTNLACLFAGATGYWGHRKSILQPFAGLPLVLGGVGAVRAADGTDSVSAVLTGGYGAKPHFTYSWRKALAHGANGHRVR
ncbi:MAG TPA: hypothetical protein VHA79_00885 [Mycobacteriales bacterium]|nr:hypothetical protein [Mycobacteriales bacterium]